MNPLVIRLMDDNVLECGDLIRIEANCRRLERELSLTCNRKPDKQINQVIRTDSKASCAVATP
ncbi:hypothetical protein D3C87_1891080 [compost metagenome]